MPFLGDEDESSGSDDSVDFFADIPSDEEGRSAHYRDFFDPVEGQNEVC